MTDRYVISIDHTKCTGCRTCEIVCSLRHVGECNPERSRIRILKSEENGIIKSVPILCFNCEDSACEKACPTGATKRGDTMNVLIVDEQFCIGCKSCVYACPSGASFFDRVKDKAFRCDQCQGEPKCVQFCSKGSLEYVQQDKLNIKQKRIKNQFLNNLLGIKPQK